MLTERIKSLIREYNPWWRKGNNPAPIQETHLQKNQKISGQKTDNRYRWFEESRKNGSDETDDRRDKKQKEERIFDGKSIFLVPAWVFLLAL